MDLSLMDPSFVALAQLRRRKLKDCVETCDEILRTKELGDLPSMFLKYRALSSDIVADETELEEDGMAEVMLDDSNTADNARPGTSFRKPLMGNRGSGQGVHPTNLGGYCIYPLIFYVPLQQCFHFF